MGKHHGWKVSAPGAHDVSYKSHKAAKNAARQVKGGRVSRVGGICGLITLGLILLPVITAYMVYRAWS